MAEGGPEGALTRLFAPPRFADAEETARARMVYWMAGTIALATTVSQLVLLALDPGDYRRFLLIAVVVWVICLGDLVLVQRGRIGAAGWFQTLAVWAAMTLSAWTSGGVGAQSITAQLVVVALGGMLVGWRGGLGFAGLALGTITGLALAEAAGVLPAPTVLQTTASRAVVVGTYVVVLAVVQLLVMRNLQGARDRALRELEERRAAETFSDTLIDTAPAIFFVVDADGRRLRWNRRFEELVGLDASGFAELGPLETVVEEDRPFVAGQLAEALETGSSEMVARLRSPGGPRDVLLTGRRLEVEGVPAVAGFGLDITDLRRAEAEVRALNDDLEGRVAERTEQLEEALRALESFSYSVSHDLRTPLRGINGYATILEEDYAQVLDDEGRRQLTRIRDNTRRMAQLIDDLLAFSRLGRQQIVREVVDMGALATAVFAEVVPAERSGDAELEIGVLPEAWGDPAMLLQVWVNLLDNAVKFSAPDGRLTVEVGARDAGGQSVYWVRDRGVGFDARYGEKVFSVFERLHGDKYEGTGIGLAICRQIVEAHGGRVWAESTPGAGATFFFSLPGGAAACDAVAGDGEPPAP